VAGHELPIRLPRIEIDFDNRATRVGNGSLEGAGVRNGDVRRRAVDHRPMSAVRVSVTPVIVHAVLVVAVMVVRISRHLRLHDAL
jgi:hypothetical protein